MLDINVIQIDMSATIGVCLSSNMSYNVCVLCRYNYNTLTVYRGKINDLTQSCTVRYNYCTVHTGKNLASIKTNSALFVRFLSAIPVVPLMVGYQIVLP